VYKIKIAFKKMQNIAPYFPLKKIQKGPKVIQVYAPKHTKTKPKMEKIHSKFRGSFGSVYVFYGCIFEFFGRNLKAVFVLVEEIFVILWERFGSIGSPTRIGSRSDRSFEKFYPIRRSSVI
jgi:hypothetical protein